MQNLPSAIDRTVQQLPTILLLCTMLPLLSCGPRRTPASSYGTELQPANQITLAVSSAGIFDPSIADTGMTARTWMSYSAVDPSPRWASVNTRAITTRLAYSDDHGKTWIDAGVRVNDMRDLQGEAKQGTWINEVSSLLFDPDAPSSERWQIYWHHYLSVHDKGEFTSGWIGFKSAASPEGLAAAREVKLFAGRIYDKADDDPMSEEQPPVGGPPVIHLDKIDEQLRYCLAFTEPGSVTTPSGIYIAMVCVEPWATNPVGLLATRILGTRSKIVLLKCASPCRPENADAWKYAGTIATSEDAKALGVKSLSAPDIFIQNGKAYLLFSPTSNFPVDGAYNGCLLSRFADLDHGLLERKKDKQIVVVKHIEGRPKTFNGACTYQQSIADVGFLYGEIKFADKPIFQLYETGPVHGDADF